MSIKRGIKTRDIMNKKGKKKTIRMKKSRFNLAKSGVLLFTLLCVLVGSINFFPITKASAEERVPSGMIRYKYVFDFGQCEGENLVYEIVTYEPVGGIAGRDNIEIKDTRFLGKIGGDSTENTSVSTSLLHYMQDNGDELFYVYDINEPASKMTRTIFKELCYCIVKTKYDRQVTGSGNKDMKIIANAYYQDAWDSHQPMEYVSVVDDGQRYQDPNYPGFYWGKWNHNFVDDNFYDCLMVDQESRKNPIADRTFCSQMKIQVNGTDYSFDTVMNDQFVCYLVSESIRRGENYHFKKIVYDETVAEVDSGSYVAVPNPDTVDPVNATIDVDLYHKYSYNGVASNEKVFTFRYTKGGQIGLVNDPLVSVEYFTNTSNSSTGSGNEYLLRSKVDLAFDVDQKCFPAVGHGGNQSFGNQFYKKTKDGEVHVAYSSNNHTQPFYTDQQFYPRGEYDLATGFIHAYAAVAQGNHVDIIEAKRYYSEKEKSTFLGTHGTVDRTYDTTEYYQRASIAAKIEYAVLDAFFPEGIEAPVGDTLTCGNWKLTYVRNKNILVAYNEDLVEGEEQCYFIMDFAKGTFYKVHNIVMISGLDTSYRLHLRKDEDKTSPDTHSGHLYQETGNFGNRYCAYLFGSNASNGGGTIGVNGHGVPFNDTDLLKNLIQKVAIEENNSLLLRFYDVQKSGFEEKRGQDQNHIIGIESEYNILNSSGAIVTFDITPWFRELYAREIEEEKDELIREHLEHNPFGAVYMTQSQLESNANSFIKMILHYAKPIIMFLIFLAVIYAGIYSLIHNQDPKERVLVKERLKHILVGTMIFAACCGIIFLCKMFMDTSFTKIEQITGSNLSTPLDTPVVEYETNWFVNLIVELLDVVAEIIAWIIRVILNAILGNQTIDLNQVIYNHGVSISDFDLAPFSEGEWARYMYAYMALEALALGLLSIAIVKLAFDLILHAENQEKKTETKMTCLRIGAAMLAIVLGPYIVRLLLLLFNWLITLVPVKDINLNLVFEGDTGLLGAIANILYQWTLFKIYLVFVVRKLMITFMLLMTPLVFGLWAISDKFRSLSLWIGELVTNSATQFCYALVFFIASLLMYENQSDFVTLIIVMMLMQLADFFKDSLQGLVEKWSGINETAIAEKTAGQMKGSVQKGARMVKKGVNTVGNATVGISNFIDPNHVSQKGRVARNIGNVLGGNIWGVETKSEVDKNAMKLLKGKANEENSKLKQYDRNYETAKAHGNVSEDYQMYYDQARRGELSLEETQTLAAGNSDYASIHEMNKARTARDSYDDASSAAKTQSKNDKNWIDNMKSNAKDNVLDQYNEVSNNRGQSKEEIFNRSREDAANKAAQLDVTRELFEQGKATEGALVQACKDAIQSTLKLGEDGKNAGMGDKLSQDLRREIVDQVTQTVQSMSGVSDATRDKVADMRRDAYRQDDGQSNASQLANVSTQLNQFEQEQKDSFAKARDERANKMRDTFGLESKEK